MSGRSAQGTLALGRLAPRWGRGLLLGAPAEPWESKPIDRGGGAPFRGRAGEGVMVGAGRSRVLEAMAGRFARREVGGMRLRGRAATIAGLVDRDGGLQGSLAFSGPAQEASARRVETELAGDVKGRWRAECVITTEAAEGWGFAGRVRAGHANFRSLAEPQRAGPAQALSLAGEVAPLGFGVRALVALWRYRASRDGSRVALSLERRLADGSRIAAGFEEHRGSRRETAAYDVPMRQGVWGELRAGGGSVALVVREELWGAQALARGTVRSLVGLGLEANAAQRIRLRLSHTVFDVGFGERLYWAERDPDRLVLRPASGRGRRTEIEVDAPVASGRLGAALRWVERYGETPGPRWTLDWSRRSSLRKREPRGAKR